MLREREIAIGTTNYAPCREAETISKTCHKRLEREQSEIRARVGRCLIGRF